MPDVPVMSLPARLRDTTRLMATRCGAPKGLWNHHSNACLEAAAEIERLLQLANEIGDRRRNLEDVSCRQQNEIKRLNTRITNLWYALDRVKHGADYCDDLGEIIDGALTVVDTGDEMHQILGEALARACTCHPDDNPPRPCPQKFALTECRAAALAGDDCGAVCPRCRINRIGSRPVYLGSKDEGHICAVCWSEDRGEPPTK